MGNMSKISVWVVEGSGKEHTLGKFIMVSQLIRLILVDWFVFHFIFLGHLPFFLGFLQFLFFLSSIFFLEVVFQFYFILRLSSSFC
jgi:hypothetical protein